MDTTFPLVLPTTSRANGEGEIRPTSILVAKKDLLCCELGDGAVILDIDSGIYYGLDIVGTSVWGLIQEPKVMSDIIGSLLQEYAVDPVQCEREVRQFLAAMIDRKLVKLTNSEQSGRALGE